MRIAAILTLVALVGCAPNAAARQQAAYAKAVAHDVVTKFILRDPNDPAHITGAYAVIKAQQSDDGAIWCTYQPPDAAIATSAYVRVLKLQSNIEQNKLYYSLIAPNDAIAIMQDAPRDGEGMLKIAEILATTPSGYDPFVTETNGTRRFLFSSCKVSQ